MKLQFTQTVQDKNTGEYYKPNTSYEFDDVRAKEILSTGYAVVIEELKGTKPIEPFADDTKEEIPKTEFAMGVKSYPLQTSGNDDYKGYREIATQKDFDLF